MKDRISLRLPLRLKRSLIAMAKEEGLTVSALVVRILQERVPSMTDADVGRLIAASIPRRAA